MKKFTSRLFAYIPGNSLFHKLHPLTKFLWIGMISVYIFLVKSILFLFSINLLLFSLAYYAGSKPKNYFRQLRWIFYIILFLVPIDIFFHAFATGGSEVLFYLAYPYFPVRKLAVYVAFRTAFALLSLATTGLIFAITTSPKDLVYGMMTAKIPYRYCFALMFGFRYITQVQREAETVALAQKSRGMAPETLRGPKRVWQFLKERLVATLVVTLRRVNTAAISMDKRGFGLYKNRTNTNPLYFQRRDGFFLVLSAGIFVFGIVYLMGLTTLPGFPSLHSIFLRYFG